MLLSVCIPTYNRSIHLRNCLHSIYTNQNLKNLSFEICISDNCSNDETQGIVRVARNKIPIRYSRNKTNIGMARNFIECVRMARGKFVWLIGDDDLFLPDALNTAHAILSEHKNVDFFFINSCHVDAQYIMAQKQPFDTRNLPTNLPRFSQWKKSGELPFLNLINPHISFDYLGGIYLSIFKKSLWDQHLKVLSPAALADSRIFSHFDNTFPHVKIFAHAFRNSQAYIHTAPLTACLSGAREWKALSVMVQSVRLLEALEEYRRNGLPWLQYVWYRNKTLSRFLPQFFLIWLHRENSGFSYLRPGKIFLQNCLYPNFYLSLVYFLGRRAFSLINRISQIFFQEKKI